MERDFRQVGVYRWLYLPDSIWAEDDETRAEWERHNTVIRMVQVEDPPSSTHMVQITVLPDDDPPSPPPPSLGSRPRMLDLFSGTGSVGKEFAARVLR